MTATKQFRVSQFGVDADGARLMVWNASGTKVLFAGSVVECDRFIADANHKAAEFTYSPFVRSHGHQPRGRGLWFFQQSTTRTAFDAYGAGGRSELVGEVIAFHGTLTDAKKQLVEYAKAEKWTAPFVAVLS